MIAVARDTMIIVVGDIVTDVLALIGTELALGSDTAARITMSGGGAGANTAAWLAVAGAPVTLVGVVGRDEAGDRRLAELAASGVKLLVRKDSRAPTGTIVVISDGHERTFLSDRAANLQLAPADVDAAIAGGATHLHLSGYVLLDEASRPAGRHALRAAAGAGLTTSVDAASAAPLRPVAADFRSWIAGADLLLANRDEAAVLAPAGRPEASARALAGVVRHAIVKRGAGGAVWATEGTLVEVAGVAAKAVDATGAGDAFAAGLLAAWLAGAAPADCLRAGAELGARAVTRPGARP